MKPPATFTSAASRRLDLLRLALIAQVILGHYAMAAFPVIPSLDWSEPADSFVGIYRLITRFGGEAAFVFVCISGFLLVPRLLASGLQQPGAAPIGTFLSARLIRIYPTLIAAIALTAICDLAAIKWLQAEPLYRVAPSYDAVAALNWTAALGNLLSLQPTLSGAFGSNGPLWTLGYIVQFYCLGALLARCLQQGPRFALGILVGLLIAGFALRPEWALLLLSWLGCGLLRWFPARGGKWAAGLAVAGLTLFVLANLLPDPVSILAAGAAGAAWLSALQYTTAAEVDRPLPATLQRIAGASFPLYAFHFPLALFVLAALSPQVDTSGLGFRLVWPFVALAPALAMSLIWQRLLDRRLAPGRA